MAKRFVAMKVPRAHRYLVTTFFYPPVRKKRTTLVPPILRPDILEAEREQGEHLLVYWAGDETVPGILKSVGRPCRIYGMEGRITEDRVDENLTYRPFSGPGFIDDLRTCRGLVTRRRASACSARPSTCSKPILTIPLAGAGRAAAERALRRAAGLRALRPRVDDGGARRLPRWSAPLPGGDLGLRAGRQHGRARRARGRARGGDRGAASRSGSEQA